MESRIGATFEGYESRYRSDSKENWFLKTSTCSSKPNQTEWTNCFSGFLETRGGVPFFSGKWEQKYLRASFGHRFRPLENFYFLRDNEYYTALPEIEQAIGRAGFLGFRYQNWSLGTYYSEQEAKQRQGFYILSPRRILEIAYSPEKKKHYASLNFKSKDFQLPGPKIVSRIQTVGEKQEIDGTFYTSFWSEKLDSEFKITGYKGKTTDLFAIDPDRAELNGKASLARLGIVSHSYFALEWIRAWNRPIVDGDREASHSTQTASSKRWEIVGAKAPLFYGEVWGGILFSLRNYSQDTIGRGIYYSLNRKFFTIEAGQEWRINGDTITEGKWSFRLSDSWNLEGAFLFQNEGNRIDSLFEARTARDETSLIFTDRSSSFRLRLLSPYVAFTVSHSRKKESKSDGIWINLQIQFPF